ncbi:hypothetical protein EVAR_76151_1 [Eumeta japonica]|uniref:Uncharacterized protein n=1 Tax=Eumeta variegata TaxID=151549 RepID=A0A4C1UVZ6_EUMVA|nr:hypothetical protein EVAR_76151_1 [Eumeta japonica]
MSGEVVLTLTDRCRFSCWSTIYGKLTQCRSSADYAPSQKGVLSRTLQATVKWLCKSCRSGTRDRTEIFQNGRGLQRHGRSGRAGGGLGGTPSRCRRSPGGSPSPGALLKGPGFALGRQPVQRRGRQ